MATSALDATAGASTANSYATLAEANQYHDDRPAAGTTWADATDAEKTAALLWATRLLDALVEWNGYTSTTTQSLLWPRSGLRYPSGYAIPVDVVPVQLKHAASEFARQLLVADRAADSDVEAAGLAALTAGPVSLTFKPSAGPKPVPDAVWSLLPEAWGGVRSRVGGVRSLVRA